MTTVDNTEAAESLDHVNKIQHKIAAQGVQEHLPFIWWGLFILFGYPPFDYLNGNMWSLIVGIVWVIGMFLTFRYFREKTSRVHTFQYQSLKASIALGVLTFITILFANVLQPNFHYTWTIIGIVLASLYIGYGLRLRSESK